MRLFLDTNVLVSAFAVRGLSADLLDVVLLEHELAIGRTVLQELEKALRIKIRLPAERCAEIIDHVSSEAVLIVENASPASCNADDDDRLVLGEALLAGAEAFVTGDAALVALGSVDKMRILTPRQLWDLLRSG